MESFMRDDESRNVVHILICRSFQLHLLQEDLHDGLDTVQSEMSAVDARQAAGHDGLSSL